MWHVACTQSCVCRAVDVFHFCACGVLFASCAGRADANEGSRRPVSQMQSHSGHTNVRKFAEKTATRPVRAILLSDGNTRDEGVGGGRCASAAMPVSPQVCNGQE